MLMKYRGKCKMIRKSFDECEGKASRDFFITGICEKKENEAKFGI